MEKVYGMGTSSGRSIYLLCYPEDEAPFGVVITNEEGGVKVTCSKEGLDYNTLLEAAHKYISDGKPAMD